MTKSTSIPPHVESSLSISPSTHSFSFSSPPTFSMTLLSHASQPITLFTWDTPLHLQGCLSNNSITIIDLTTGTPVPTCVVRIQRKPITRLRGSGDEQLYLTLEPDISVTLTKPFGRGPANGSVVVKPLPKHLIQHGWELNGKGEQIKIRRLKRATGVDGLEAGHSYEVSVRREMLECVKWAFATKEEVLVDERKGAAIQDFEWEGEAKIEWDVTAAVVDVID
ncbi:hypothetical protein QM012_005582 [Aureobasidium pullulans]|uniref:DUF4139 domain-containing protein n=1 Tax=Aureobasidium pullulans TaxID=5580 RepID=A0ABR0T4P7_AURPU